MTQTPASLLERLRQPFDTDAWGRFVSLYTPLMVSWCRSVGLKEHDAADLIQDVFVTLLRVLPTFSYDREKSFRRWLRTITLNTWRNARKRPDNRLARREDVNLDAMPGTDALEALWEAEYQQHLAGRAMRVMQADFEEKTWKACWEVVVADRPAGEVAAELGLTVGAVYAARFRILARLRRELDGMLD